MVEFTQIIELIQKNPTGTVATILALSILVKSATPLLSLIVSKSFETLLNLLTNHRS